MFPRGAKLSGPDDNLGFAGVIFINSYSTRSCIVHFGFDTGQAELNVDFIMLLRESLVLYMWQVVILGTIKNSVEKDSS